MSFLIFGKLKFQTFGSLWGLRPGDPFSIQREIVLVVEYKKFILSGEIGGMLINLYRFPDNSNKPLTCKVILVLALLLDYLQLTPVRFDLHTLLPPSS